MRAGLASFIVILISPVILSAQEAPQDEGGIGGLFTRLKNVVEEVAPPAEKNSGVEKSWLERAKELGSSTLGKGKQGFEDLVTSGTEANTKMSEMLSYLDKKMAGREPSFSDAEIQSLAIEMIPLVEELNKRKFKSPPRVAVTGNFEMIQILGNDLMPQYQKQFPEVSKSSIFLRSYISAGLFAPALMGKYGVTDKAVYVLPENVKATMAARDIPEKLDRDLMKIIIAHELTHALQDQEMDLNSSLMKVEDSDASLAFQALVEGHAVYIQNAAARRLKLNEAAKAGRDMLTAPEQDGEEWLVNQVSMADAVKWESIYLGGEKFVSHYTNKEGIDKIWQILENPPSRTSMIVKPSTYTPQALPVPNYDSLFSDSVAILEVPEWKVTVQAMVDFKIQSHLGAVPRAQREAIIKGLKKSALLNFSNSAAGFGQTIDTAVFQFSDASGAASMVSALEQLTENDINSAEASAMVEVLTQKKISYDAGDGVAGSAFRYRTKTVILGEATTSVIQVKKNHVVAQLIYTDVDLKKRPVDAFLRYVVERFE